VVRLRVAPDGTILSRELIKSSGQADWDQAVLDAIDRDVASCRATPTAGFPR